MLKTHWRVVNAFERIGDNFLIAVAFFLTYHIRDSLLLFAREHALVVSEDLRALAPLKEYILIPALALPLFNAALSVQGAYKSMRLSSLFQILKTTVSAGAVVFLCLSSLLYIFKFDLSRSFVGIFCALCTILFFAERFFVLVWLRYFRSRGRNFRNVLIVGTGEQARKLFIEVSRQPELGIRVVGFVSTEQSGAARVAENGGIRSSCSAIVDLPARVVATAETFEGALKRHAVDEVIFTDIVHSLHVIEELAALAVEEGVGVTLAADFFSLELVRSDLSYLGSVPLVHYRPTPIEAAPLIAKRAIDIVVSAIGLVVLAPLLLAAVVAIRWDSPGPIFFRQRRVGLNGRLFTLLKFRSMVQDAEKLLPQLRQKNEMTGPVFKMKDDPRVTRVGRILRRYSIDELPQLVNVLRGDMSLVGPRPPLPEEVAHYKRKQRRRLSMRPGLTCTWQVSGRNEIPDFEQWTALDLEYIDNWSLKRDFQLLLKTIPAVFSGSGAR